MNLYLRKDGRYESRVPNGKKPDGIGRFYTSLHAPKSSVSSVFKPFISNIGHRGTAL